ncbi:Hypothetical protein LBL_2306 [Leptospira borgpetersenii serovar Hardjo-bovis str. L550]|nr:Hypothetical protein LBL_2306 [Leptospira borgpetersenii serovar Hardjo-bovis str. L550]
MIFLIRRSQKGRWRKRKHFRSLWSLDRIWVSELGLDTRNMGGESSAILTEVNFSFYSVFREFRFRLQTVFQKDRLSEQVKESACRKRDRIFENAFKMRIAENLC